MKKETGLGLTYKKDENFGEWYSEVRRRWFVDRKNGFIYFVHAFTIEQTGRQARKFNINMNKKWFVIHVHCL